MNTFYEHHQHSIKLSYRCFHRILLNGLIQPFQQPERVIGFFNAYRSGQRVSRHLLRDIAEQFHNWVKNRAQKWGAPIIDPPAARRDEFEIGRASCRERVCPLSIHRLQGVTSSWLPISSTPRPTR